MKKTIGLICIIIGSIGIVFSISGLISGNAPLEAGVAVVIYAFLIGLGLILRR